MSYLSALEAKLLRLSAIQINVYFTLLYITLTNTLSDNVNNWLNLCEQLNIDLAKIIISRDAYASPFFAVAILSVCLSVRYMRAL